MAILVFVNQMSGQLILFLHKRCYEFPSLDKWGSEPSPSRGGTELAPEVFMVLSQNEWVNNIPSPLTGEGQGGGDSTVNRITILGKALRKRPTDAEQLLWSYLRMKQMEGLKFRRQQPIDKYIVDFVCFENRVIIEVDGGQHAAEKNKDIEREKYLQRYGFKVLRFWNNEVLQNTNEVLAVIRDNCLSHPPLNPLPSREGKEKM